MRETEFKEWLEAQGYDPGTVRAQIDRSNRLARAYGDLDTLTANGGLDRLQRELAYSKEDERWQSEPLEGHDRRQHLQWPF